MGQKANPNAMRIGLIHDWHSRYFCDGNNWSFWIYQDDQIRKFFAPYFKEWLLSSIEIERTKSMVRVIINTAKPGIVLGQEGNNIKKVEKKLIRLINNRSLRLKVDVKEVRKYEQDAMIVANEIATSLERRVPFRVAQKRVIRKVMRSGVEGIKTQVSGRLNGVDMARTEGYLEGRVPLQTLRYDIDFAKTTAKTTYGILGVKVWISKGEKLENRKRAHLLEKEKRGRRNPRNNSRREREHVNTKTA